MNATKPSAAALLERANDVATLTVVHVSDDLRSSLAFGPADLDTFEPATRRVVDDPSAIAESLARLRATELVAYDGAINLRWGLTYADAAGKTIGAVYLDRFGIAGYVGNRPAEFDDEGAFMEYVRATYPD